MERPRRDGGCTWPSVTPRPMDYRPQKNNGSFVRPAGVLLRPFDSVDCIILDRAWVGSIDIRGIRQTPVPFPRRGSYSYQSPIYDLVDNIRDNIVNFLVMNVRDRVDASNIHQRALRGAWPDMRLPFA